MARKRTRNRLDERAPYDEDEERRDEEDELSDDEEDEEEDEESSEDADEEEDEDLDEDDEGRPRKKKSKKKSAKVKEGKEKVRTRSPRQTRLKVVWGVFNNSNVQVATYPFTQEAEARAHADRLTNDKKVTHFVQKVKVPFDEK